MFCPLYSLLISLYSVDLNRVFDGTALFEGKIVAAIPAVWRGGFFDFYGCVFVVWDFSAAVDFIEGEDVGGRFSKVEGDENGALGRTAGD